MPAVAPFLFGISVAAALPFHRARHDVAPAAPVWEARRALARLLAALPFVVVTAAFAVAGRLARARPRRPVDRHGARPHHRGPPHQAELAQLVALALLAVALGAALGRRTSPGWWPWRCPCSSSLWFAASASTGSSAQAAVTPFSIMQVQPVAITVGPTPADPLSFPSDWLLVGHPGDYQRGLAAASGLGGARVVARHVAARPCRAAARRRVAPAGTLGHCSPRARSSPWQASSAQHVVIP